MKLKPILIPTNKARLCIINYKGELSEFKPEMKGAPNDDAFILEDTKDISINPQHIILIDTEAKIITNNWYYDCESETVLQCDIDQIKAKTCSKVLSTTSKEVDLPLLSPQSIQLLINYYNQHKCMPDSVETCKHIIDCEASHDGDTKYTMLNQQGEVDITIPKTKESWNREEVRMKIVNFYLEEDHWDEDEVEEWLSKNL